MIPIVRTGRLPVVGRRTAGITAADRDLHRHLAPGREGQRKASSGTGWILVLKGAGDVDNPGIRARSVSSCRNASILAIEKPPQKPVGWRSGYEGRILASKGQSASTPLLSPVAAVSVNRIDCAMQIGIVVAIALTVHRTGPSDRIDRRHDTGAPCRVVTDAIRTRGNYVATDFPAACSFSQLFFNTRFWCHE
jgi:hypothetical protein